MALFLVLCGVCKVFWEGSMLIEDITGPQFVGRFCGIVAGVMLISLVITYVYHTYKEKRYNAIQIFIIVVLVAIGLVLCAALGFFLIWYVGALY